MKIRNLVQQTRRMTIPAVLCAMLLALLLPGVVAAAPAAATEAPVTAAPAATQASGVYHTVRRGDTLSGLARWYGTSVQAIMQANGLRTTTIFVGQVLFIPTGGGGGGGHHSCSQFYYVQRGDTLSGIARWFGVSTSALAQANGISNPSRIYAGQRLCIPSGGHYPPDPPRPSCGQFYVVQKGDNLSRIAARCGTTVQRLVHLNGLSHPSLIFPGQVLRMW